MRNTYLQFIQLITGVLIAVLLGIHMVIQHLDAILGFFGIDVRDATSWPSMIGRAKQGIWALIYIALLIFALYHAFNGLRNILLELTSSARTERVITVAIIVVGVIFLILGVWAPIVLLSK
jgi:succinate dehydrogenase hydrophobic anchor subunit